MQKGFTLIELMIVVAIIGILSAIAIPAYQDYIARAQVSEALILATQYKISISQTYSQTSNCPTLSELGLNSPTDAAGKYIQSVNVAVSNDAVCAIEFTFKNDTVANSIQGKHLVLAMISQTTDLGASNWRCTSIDIEQKNLPLACKKI